MNEDNIYSAPLTDVELQPSQSGRSNDVVHELKSQSTWRLFFLTVITLGVYLAHYIARQTPILNRHLEPKDQISQGLVKTILILSYISVVLFIPSIILDESVELEGLSSLFDIVLNILLLVWAFKARKRMHTVLGSLRKTSNWFNGLWTFLFPGFYFNYKINSLSERA
jgi:hypothetical protein